GIAIRMYADINKGYAPFAAWVWSNELMTTSPTPPNGPLRLGLLLGDWAQPQYASQTGAIGKDFLVPLEKFLATRDVLTCPGLGENKDIYKGSYQTARCSGYCYCVPDSGQATSNVIAWRPHQRIPPNNGYSESWN